MDLKVRIYSSSKVHEANLHFKVFFCLSGVTRCWVFFPACSIYIFHGSNAENLALGVKIPRSVSLVISASGHHRSRQKLGA